MLAPLDPHTPKVPTVNVPATSGVACFSLLDLAVLSSGNSIWRRQVVARVLRHNPAVVNAGFQSRVNNDPHT